MREQVQKLWGIFSAYKEKATKEELNKIVMFDLTLTNLYNSLEKEWNEERAELFIKNIRFVFSILGIKED